MVKRIQIDRVEPSAYKGMFTLEQYLQESELSNTHKNLIKIRASQLNSCAFCINMHTKEALTNGEKPQRIFLLNAWKESGLFTNEEKIILQLTEEITLIHTHGLTDNTYQKAIQYFGENYLAQIIMAVTIINAWNRISVSTHKPVEG
ncbi:carboxymuconolactone decarboxylase family protein [Abyssalbus ytuae]|uniref:Carboxymuconolactone decarboxylase family protein n=1 Tax=Abyssalbus ytuae TaxID=2926907 RepID=A0A9E7A0Y3_9FLAO|nr:carboxymuconolactone decarboxylase family protein [Abyssalbus ytuae]UOB18952.1 carboxymuconolactone decarboxylase family protein [Abyssalbus ytuae]